MSLPLGSLPGFTSVMISPPNFSPLVNSFRQTPGGQRRFCSVTCQNRARVAAWRQRRSR